MKVLVLDFGGPVLRTPFELLRGGERRAGLAAGTLDWTGPFDPSRDAGWRRLQDGEITERAYWQDRADCFARLTGGSATFHGLMDVLFAGDEAELLRPEARPTIRDARDAGLAVAVLTNDMRAFHGDAWVERMTVLREIDVLVDGSVEHVLKPDPAIYRLLTSRLGVAAEDCLFVDDQPVNITGAQSVGMRTLWFDVTRPAESYALLRELLGLTQMS
jgi:putative hydrolase of the HAD superfamily